MVLKFITAGVISAVLAGGAMYLAMDEDMLAQLRSEAKRGHVAENIPSLRRGPEAEKSGDSVVDRLLGRDGAKTQPETPPVAPILEPQDIAEDGSASDPTATNEASANAPDRDASTADETPNQGLPNRVGQKVEEAPPKRGWLEEFLPRRDDSDVATPALGEVDGPLTVNKSIFESLLEQAALVGIVDARDDAYLNILNYSLAQSRYDVAGGLVENLSSPELRDTARQRIGISHAQAGRMDAAFAVVDDIEVKELSDPIRLEIIRSVTMTRQPG